MGSYIDGKHEVVLWIAERVPDGGTILDVGPCDGIWSDFIRAICDDVYIDACEIFTPNIAAHNLIYKYRRVYAGDIADLKYDHYDIVIFGDVLEHMTVEKAQAVLAYAREHSTDYVIGIPFEYEQDEIYGNPWEKHLQPDLTPAIFDERYPDHELIIQPRADYAYYHRR